ncbi:hypothetical protein B0H19DRAFT_1082302 [Mycena capillaripes]|nr:hypothetical protein B0H19DRAFT_1082302 [Mycena capillaripes]
MYIVIRGICLIYEVLWGLSVTLASNDVGKLDDRPDLPSGRLVLNKTPSSFFLCSIRSPVQLVTGILCLTHLASRTHILVIRASMVRVKVMMTPTSVLIFLGGRGGLGGGGGAGGQGGGGGTGEGPTLNYAVNSEYFTMNLVMRTSGWMTRMLDFHRARFQGWKLVGLKEPATNSLARRGTCAMG